MKTWSCGHPRTAENTRNIKHPRCRICASTAQKNNYAFNRALERIESAKFISDANGSQTSIANGSKQLLEALWREHPRIVAHLTRGNPETIERQRRAAARLEEARMRFALVEREAARLGVADIQA